MNKLLEKRLKKAILEVFIDKKPTKSEQIVDICYQMLMCGAENGYPDSDEWIENFIAHFKGEQE